MKKVWKENIDLRKLDSHSRIVLNLPVGAKIVHVGQSLSEQLWTHNQGWENPEYFLTIWFEFYQSYGDQRPPATEGRELYVFGTNHPIPEHLIYRGTKVGGTFVWHVYERT